MRSLRYLNGRTLSPFPAEAEHVSMVTLLSHWSSFRIFGLLLPKDRTALFFAPLSLLVFGVATAISGGSRIRCSLRVVGIVLLCIGALYFVGSLRLSYFKEWKFDADVKTAFS